MQHAPTLTRPRWGREPPVPDDSRCRTLVQGCDVPLEVSTAYCCTWWASQRLALPGDAGACTLRASWSVVQGLEYVSHTPAALYASRVLQRTSAW